MTAVDEIRRAVEERFAEGAWVDSLLQALTAQGVKTAMKSVMWMNSVPNAQAYRVNVLRRIKVRQAISRLYRNDYYMQFDEYDEKMTRLKHELRQLTAERAALRANYSPMDFANLSIFDQMDKLDPPSVEPKVKVKYGKCKKRKMRKIQHERYGAHLPS